MRPPAMGTHSMGEALHQVIVASRFGNWDSTAHAMFSRYVQFVVVLSMCAVLASAMQSPKHRSKKAKGVFVPMAVESTRS